MVRVSHNLASQVLFSIAAPWLVFSSIDLRETTDSGISLFFPDEK